MKKVFTGILILVTASASSSAQTAPADTVNRLPDFTLRENRFETFNTGVKVIYNERILKKIANESNLAQVLSTTSQVFIKAYGHNQLASTSFRGAEAQHTAVLWNGINLQNTMHGQLDFSLISSGFIDEVGLSFGGNSALFGGGAIGGAVLLNNLTAYNERLAGYAYTMGSFAFNRHQADVTYGTSKWFIKVRGTTTDAKNDLPFENYSLPGKPVERLKHAALISYGTIIESGYRFRNKDEVTLRYWYNYNNRELPPTIGMGVNNSWQIDDNNRLGGEWKRIRSRSRWVARGAWLRDMIDYNDPSTYITGKSTANSLVGEADHTLTVNRKLTINSGVNYTFIHAESNGYARPVERNTAAIFVSGIARLSGKLRLSTSLREEFVDAEIQPFTASAGMEYDAWKWLMFTAHADKSYRIPTLNDLYWITGNPDLHAENGYGQEIGIKLVKAKMEKQYHASAAVNGFNRNITNWIMWQPLGGSWTPQNIKEVWSRGGELKLILTVTRKKSQLTLKSDYSYIMSTNRSSVPGDATEGKQLIYIPRLTHQHWAIYSYGNFAAAIHSSYTGYRFTSSDNTSFLNDYTLADVYVRYAFRLKATMLEIKVQYNNIFNARYEVLPARPMPGNNFMISAGIRMNK